MNVAKFVVSWGMVFCYVVLNAFGALLIKHEINRVGEANITSFHSILIYFVKLLTSYKVLLGLVAIFLSALAWFVALSRMDLSVAYPIAVGLSFLLIVTSSVLFFHESLTPIKLLGLLFLILGLIFVSRS